MLVRLPIVLLLAVTYSAPLSAQQQPGNTTGDQPKPLVTNPRPVKVIPIPGVVTTFKCDDGWTLVMIEFSRPMCARELKDPNPQ